MTQRKPISKKLRFEVFKRDKFTCQYCGRMSPDVILEVDHIKPVCEGGTNSLLNLITSCRDCNRGKGKRKLSDDTTVKKQQEQLRELAERKEQLEFMIQWKNELEELSNTEIDCICDYITSVTDLCVTDVGRLKLKKIIKEFGFKDVFDATETSINQYFDGRKSSLENAFNKISGICYNKKEQKTNPQIYFYNYIKKACVNKYGQICRNENSFKNIITDIVIDESEFETVKRIINSSDDWSEFVFNFRSEYEGE